MILNDWKDLSILHRNRLPARAYFESFYGTESTSLNGLWKFMFLDSPGRIREEYYSKDFDADRKSVV